MPKIKTALITAGPTREMLDPVRFISNISTGEMGYALARAAKRRGLKTTLISGPTSLRPPRGVRFIPIVSAKELEQAVLREFRKTALLLMSAAVCDFTPRRIKSQKIKRKPTLLLSLKNTTDILKKVAVRKGKRIIVGFCLETENLLKRARRKLKEKKLDLIVACLYNKANQPFGKTLSRMSIIDRKQRIYLLPKASKDKIATCLLNFILKSECPSRG